MTDNEARGTRLRQARQAAGFTDAAEAARALGIPPPTYTHHENGTRGFRADRAAQYARRFNVSVEWLLYGRGDAKAAQRSPGFAEDEVEPIGMADYVRFSNHFLAENAATFRLHSNVDSFGLRPGSIVLVDLKTTPQSGDFVIVTWHDGTGNDSRTLVRRLVGGELVRSAYDPPEQIDSQMTIRGRIVQAIVDF